MRWIVAIAVAVTSACASGGGGGAEGPDPADVTIYMRSSDVRCAYETVQPLRGYVTYSSVPEYLRERDAYLRRAASRVGADAVLIPEERREPDRDNVGLSFRRVNGITQPSETAVEGIAIRLTC